MQLSTLPLVVCNVILATIGNASLRQAARTPERERLFLVAAATLNISSFSFWYVILRHGEDLASTQITVSSSMIVMSLLVGGVVFGETTTWLQLAGAGLALTAVIVMFAATQRTHDAMPPESTADPHVGLNGSV